jgi:agmatinase
MNLDTLKPPHTFANFEYCNDLESRVVQIAILGVPYGTSYPHDTEVPCKDAPRVLREESNRYPDDPIAWDFDLGGTLLGGRSQIAVDCGDVPGEVNNPEGNRLAAQSAVRGVLKSGAIPIVLGGDDSVPIPVMRAFADQEPMHLVQIDAHIDWRDEVEGIRDGYSSTMRRASELPQVEKIVQVGMRGVGSARQEEYQAALDYSVEFVTSYQLKEEGNASVLTHLPQGSRCFLTIDFDALDPSEMPAVGGPTPGGLQYIELINLIHALAVQTKVVGVCLVELVPSKDINQLGAITAMRVVWNVIGSLLKGV